MATLHLDIDGQWSAGEFAGVLLDLQELYAFSYLVSRIWEKAHSNEFPTAAPLGSLQTIPKILISKSRYSFVDPQELELRLVRVKYGSKGFTDLLGVGKIIETLKVFHSVQREVFIRLGRRPVKIVVGRRSQSP
jgi:hypothetical protein